MIAGIGIDLCDVARIARAIEGPEGQRFRERVFTPGERAFCDRRRGRARTESYAARFAAKEAAMKALGTGWGQGVSWHDVEVEREPDGPPVLRLHGRAATLARARGLDRWLLSVSHSDALAIAWVLVESDGPTVRAGDGRAVARRRGAASRARRRSPTPRR
jgi:holo-[acyl-carrier protein] synthase